MRWFSPVLMDSAHSHGHIEMNWLNAGHLDYVFDGRPVRVPERRLVVFWAGVPHQALAIERGRQDETQQCNIYLPLDAFLHMSHVDNLHEVMMGGGVICLGEGTVGAETLRRWYGDYRTGNPERQDILKVEIGAMLRRAALVGWTELHEPWIEPVQSPGRQSAPARYVVAMVKYILENLSQPLKVADVARAAGLHPTYALSLFTAVMRLPIKKFVVRMRLLQARALLFESNLSIANVAFQSGFNSQSQFYTHFRRAYGVTPLDLRRQLRGVHV